MLQGEVETTTPMNLFSIVVMALSVASGVVLAVYLYASDGPVYRTNSAVVDDDSGET